MEQGGLASLALPQFAREVSRLGLANDLQRHLRSLSHFSLGLSNTGQPVQFGEVGNKTLAFVEFCQQLSCLFRSPHPEYQGHTVVFVHLEWPHAL